MQYSEILSIDTQAAADKRTAIETAFSCDTFTATAILGECRSAYLRGRSGEPIYDWLSPHDQPTLVSLLGSDGRFDGLDLAALAALMFDAWGSP